MQTKSEDLSWPLGQTAPSVVRPPVAGFGAMISFDVSGGAVQADLDQALGRRAAGSC